MTDKSGLGNRMKGYERVSNTKLINRMPVIIRLDGRAFHTLTRKMEKPMDYKFLRCMYETALAVAHEVDGCTLGYLQSDEISLLVTDYATFYTEAWFNYRVQKMCSIAASIASVAFNISLASHFDRYKPVEMFDCRVFNLPKEEVNNYFLWRQRDATRNSISSLANANFSHKSLQGLNSKQLQDKLMLEKGINWNDCPVVQKRGACVIKETYEVKKMSGVATRSKWVVDDNIPIFSQDPEYVNSRVEVEI